MSTTSVRLVPHGQELRAHPRVRLLLHEAEGRHFTDDELKNLTRSFPSLQVRAETARHLRKAAPAAVDTVVRMLADIYPMANYSEVAIQKSARDLHYTLAYAEHAMIMDDPQWFDDKLLIWMKTILRAFDFPDVRPGAQIEAALQEKLRRLPAKARCIYHGYYRLRLELRDALPEQAFRLLNPFLEQINQTLMEDYHGPNP